VAASTAAFALASDAAPAALPDCAAALTAALPDCAAALTAALSASAAAGRRRPSMRRLFGEQCCKAQAHEHTSSGMRRLMV
jgi:hypothetical protein